MGKGLLCLSKELILDRIQNKKNFDVWTPSDFLDLASQTLRSHFNSMMGLLFMRIRQKISSQR